MFNVSMGSGVDRLAPQAHETVRYETGSESHGSHRDALVRVRYVYFFLFLLSIEVRNDLFHLLGVR